MVISALKMGPAKRFELLTGGLRRRGLLNLPVLKLKLSNYGLNDLQFFHHRGVKSRKL